MSDLPMRQIDHPADSGHAPTEEYGGDVLVAGEMKHYKEEFDNSMEDAQVRRDSADKSRNHGEIGPTQRRADRMNRNY